MKQTPIKLIFSGLCACLITLFPFNVINAQDNTIVQEKSIEIKKVSEEPKLVADKAVMKNELMAIDSVLLVLEMDMEGLLPADELYDGEWNNEYVKAYANIDIPDKYDIDVRSFVMPIAGRVTSKYGPRRRRFHYGTDIKLQTGDTIVAAFDGKVRVKKYERRGYGYYLVLRHPNGLETVYGHLSEFLVDEDQNIKAGEPIALGGNTGRSTGSHLHFETRFLGQPVNPEEIIDFENECTYDEVYAFNKAKSGKRSSSNKYVASSKTTKTTKTTKATKSSASSGNGQVKYHRIKQGDCLSAIAQKYGVSVSQLCRLNGIKKTSVLKVGRSIRYS